MITEYKRPGNRPSKVVLTTAIRNDLKSSRGFKETHEGKMMSRNIGDVHIQIWENGNCNILIPNRCNPISFVVDQYWATSILYIAQMELNKDAARIRKEADEVSKLADSVMDVVCGKQVK